MASGTPSAPITSSRGAAGSSPGRKPRLPTPPPPHLCSHYTTRVKNYKGASADVGRRKNLYVRGGIFLRERQRKGAVGVRVAEVGAGGPNKIPQCRNMSHSAGKTLCHILIHCETIPYPHTLPKNTNLIQCRNYTFS